MNTYKVTVDITARGIKTFEVEAEDEDKAEDIAIGYAEDNNSWLDDADLDVDINLVELISSDNPEDKDPRMESVQKLEQDIVAGNKSLKEAWA